MRASASGLSLVQRWLAFSTVFITSLMSVYSMFKAPPLFTVLIPELNFSPDTIGLMVSMFSIIGIVLAFPAGMLINRIGIKTSLIISCVSVIVGSTLGALASDWWFMLFARAVEGIGLACIAVVAGVAVAAIIPARQRGMAMGIVFSGFPLGTTLAMNSTPMLFAAFGWRSAWWAGVLFACLSLILVLCFFKIPVTDTGEGRLSPAAVDSQTFRQRMLKRTLVGVLVASFCFMLWNFVWTGAFGGFYPTFLHEVLSTDISMSGFMTGLPNILMVFFGPLIGIISDRINNCKGIMIFSFVGSAALFSFAFSDNYALIWVFLIVESVFAAGVGPAIYSLIPKLARSPQQVSWGMACVSFAQNLGIVIGSALFGILVTMLGWITVALVVLVPRLLLGAVLSVLMIKEKVVEKESDTHAA
jgi:predicted MFS family arabinose efflux permease